jgi:hypothetical protein
MEVIAAFTLYVCFGAVVIFPHASAPPLLERFAGCLLGAEFLALVVWSSDSGDCKAGDCGALAETARTAASVDIPALTAVLIVVAAGHARRATRRVSGTATSDSARGS